MKAVGAAAVIVLLSVLAYAPAWRAGYVWDDDSILKNEVIRARDGLFKIWIHPSENRGEKHYWPLVYSTFWIERQSWGLNPRSSHAINVALHAANALILFFL
ncbi:hypothetical protein HYR69_05820, partial [Candidatus Sumerlaeota bacterium]|nr:hypothetical protein [Candidatus Sumerlaeota bacterium]